MYNQQTSPNKSAGRNGQKPEAIILHVCDGAFEGSLNWLTNPRSMVSAHFLISKKGEVIQLVDPKDTAWHAGVVKNPTWKLLKKNLNPNSYTIGIELAGFAYEKPSQAQIWATGRLVRELAMQYNITIDGDHIIPHRWINGGKTCPGYNINVDVITYLALLPLDS